MPVIMLTPRYSGWLLSPSAGGKGGEIRSAASGVDWASVHLQSPSSLVPEVPHMFGTASRRRRVLLALAAVELIAAIGVRAYRVSASDHRDSALLTANNAEDIADVYSFLNPSNPDRLV